MKCEATHKNPESQFADKNGCRKLEQYMTTIGEGKVRLSISYTKQDTLPDVQATEEQQAVLAAD